jgi:curli biogenesis system outer membrane secretion channel CsgG
MKKNICALFFTLLMLLSNIVRAEVVNVVSKGMGVTEEKAINSALASAVAQINGISLESFSNTQSNRIQTEINDGNKKYSSTINAERQSSDSVFVRGQVEGYEIISSTPVQNLYEVELSVDVYKYDLPSSSSRKKVALLPIKVHQSSFKFFGTKSSDDMTGLFNNAIERYLVQSRRFAILSRSDFDDLSKEFAFINSDATSVREKAKLGQSLGGDYILIPELIEANAGIIKKQVKITGQTRSTVNGQISLHIKVIVTATGEVKFSERYTISSAKFTKALGKHIARASLDPKLARTLIANDAIDSIVSLAVNDLIDRIYPKLIVKLNGSQVLINSGGNSIAVGEHYDVFHNGETIIDPYTGESMGSDVTWVALIKVTKVGAKMAYAQVTEGIPEKIRIGDVCRQKKIVTKKIKKEVGRKTDIEINESGGVFLPFD